MRRLVILKSVEKTIQKLVVSDSVRTKLRATIDALTTLSDEILASVIDPQFQMSYLPTYHFEENGLVAGQILVHTFTVEFTIEPRGEDQDWVVRRVTRLGSHTISPEDYAEETEL